MAIISWLAVGGGGTLLFATTFSASLGVSACNLLQMDDWMRVRLSHYLSKQSGLQVITLSSTLEPRWQDGRIKFGGVQLQRQTSTANLTNFDITVDSMEVQLDLLRYLNGHGLISECYLSGIRGTIDRRHLDFTNADPQDWIKRRDPYPNDLDLLHLEIQDCQLKVLDFNDFRPYSVHLHSVICSRFRVQWLLNDFMKADLMTGEYDGAMFSLTKVLSAPQSLPFTILDQQHLSSSHISKFRVNGINIDMLNTGAKGPFGWIDRGTADIDCYIVFPPVFSLTAAIAEGVEQHPAHHFMLEPADDGISLENMSAEMEEIRVKMLDEVVEPMKQKLLEELRDRQRLLQMRLSQLGNLEINALFKKHERDVKTVPSEDLDDLDEEPEEIESPIVPIVQFQVDLTFHNIHASIPASSSETLSFIPQTLIRPIVAYLNAQPLATRGRKTSTPPLILRFALPYTNFYGAWSVYQCELMQKIEETVGLNVARGVVGQYGSYIGRRPDVSSKDTTVKEESIATSDSQEEPETMSWWAWLMSPFVLSKPSTQTSTDAQKPQETGISEAGPRILARVGWWSLQQVSKSIMDALNWLQSDSDSVGRASLDPFSNVYNEMMWSDIKVSELQKQVQNSKPSEKPKDT